MLKKEVHMEAMRVQTSLRKRHVQICTCLFLNLLNGYPQSPWNEYQDRYRTQRHADN